MKVEADSFSGARIYPGTGKLYARIDNRIFRFFNGKSESLFLQRKNPRKIGWTVLFRRMHKKGASEEAAKRRTRKTVKVQRAVVGASLDDIRKRQRPEARAQLRTESLAQRKQKKAASDEAKKAAKAKVQQQQNQQQKVSKVQTKGAAGKGR
ncbi:60S ribosomal protein L24 [Savitreella phatthalungensis]